MLRSTAGSSALGRYQSRSKDTHVRKHSKSIADFQAHHYKHLKVGGNSTDPSGANPEASPATAAAMENSPTEQTAKHKMDSLFAFFKKTWLSVKSAIQCRHQGNKVTPHQPVSDTDSADPPEDPQSGSSDPDQDPDASKMTAVVAPSGLVSAGLQDPADPLPGPSTLDPVAPKFPGASKHRRITDRTHFRAACFTDPTPVPFDEIYEVGRKIGEGGFGTVYEGISKFLREQVAIKIIPKRDRDRFIVIPGCSKPLFAEVALNLLLKRPPLSPYIVHMLEWFEEDDRFILILEYPQPCKDLLKFMLNNMQLLDESQTRRLMYQAVLGAKHCLDRGIFHRDIKLNNFLINTKTNQVKLIDFGCGDLVKSSGYLGFTGRVCPPEYYKDLKYEAGPTTVWSLGFMMYSMIYKRQPFRSLKDMMHGSLRFKHKISTELQDLICRCMTLDPTERATVEEILQHEWFQQGQMSGGAQDQQMLQIGPSEENLHKPFSRGSSERQV
uniref:non-specific serine/threonine protein kinase n=1 Tax=Cyprinus carpio TaxID=7962 RepID=A0A8C2H7A4_CYPCA